MTTTSSLVCSYIVIHGIRLRYLDTDPSNSDRPAVLLIHGHTSRIEEYTELIPLLAPHFRLIVPDLPGCGLSEKPDRAYSLELYETVLLGLMDALAIERAHVAGGSLGGNLALRLGHRYPERFTRIAAWAPGGSWNALHPCIGRLLRLIFRPGVQRLLFWPMVRFQSRFWFEDSWPGKPKALADTFAYYREVLSPGFVRMYWEIVHAQLTQSLFDIAARITQPTLVLWGDRDHGLNMGVGVRRLVTLLPQAVLKIFPGARHSLASEIPGALAASLISFLGS